MPVLVQFIELLLLILLHGVIIKDHLKISACGSNTVQGT